MQMFLCARAALYTRSPRNTPACGNRPQTAGGKPWDLANQMQIEEDVLVSVNPAAQLVFAGRRQARQLAHLLQRSADALSADGTPADTTQHLCLLKLSADPASGGRLTRLVFSSSLVSTEQIENTVHTRATATGHRARPLALRALHPPADRNNNTPHQRYTQTHRHTRTHKDTHDTHRDKHTQRYDYTHTEIPTHTDTTNRQTPHAPHRDKHKHTTETTNTTRTQQRQTDTLHATHETNRPRATSHITTEEKTDTPHKHTHTHTQRDTDTNTETDRHTYRAQTDTRTRAHTERCDTHTRANIHDRHARKHTNTQRDRDRQAARTHTQTPQTEPHTHNTPHTHITRQTDTHTQRDKDRQARAHTHTHRHTHAHTVSGGTHSSGSCGGRALPSPRLHVVNPDFVLRQIQVREHRCFGVRILTEGQT